MRECLIVHQLDIQFLVTVLHPQAPPQLAIGNTRSRISLMATNLFSVFVIRQLHEAYAIFHACYNHPSHPVNEQKQRHMLIVRNKLLSRVVSVLMLMYKYLITVPISYSCHE